MRTDDEPQEQAGWITNLLAFLARFGSRHPWLVVAFTLATCAASMLASVWFLQYHTQRNDLISPNRPCFQHWQQYVAEFGDDDDMVVVVEGGDRARMERALEDVAAEVKLQPELFDRLFYKVDLRSLSNRSLLFMPSDQIRRIQEKLREMSLLLELSALMGLDATWQEFKLQNLLHETKGRVARVLDGKDASQEDYFRQMAKIFQQARDYLDDSGSYRNPWLSIVAPPSGGKAEGQEDFLDKVHFFFSADNTLATLLVRPKKHDKDGFTFAQKSIDGVRSLLAEMRKKYPDLKFGLTGLPVLENDEMLASQRDSNLASGLALISIALFYLAIYRGLRFPFMTVATLLVGTAWAIGWLTLTVGHLNILSSAFAVMLIGIGDYGVLWVSRFTQEIQVRASRLRGGSGSDTAELHEAIHRTAISVGPGIMTAAMTTALAFFATMFAGLKAVAELGWIAGCGVLLCALSSFIIMPALLSLLMRFRTRADVQGRRNEGGGRRMVFSSALRSPSSALVTSRPWLPALTHRPRLIIPICLGLTAILAYFASSIRYDHNMLHMQAQSLDAVQWEHKLIAKNTGSAWYALSYTSTREEALALKAEYKRLPEVSQVRDVVELVPLNQKQKLEQLRDIQERLRRLPERGKIIPHKLPDVGDLVRTAEQVIASLEDRTDESLVNLRQSLIQLVHRIEAMDKSTPNLAGKGLREFEELFTRSLADDLHRLRDVSQPRPIEIADLPPSLRERYIGKSGKWLLQIFAKETLWDFGPLEKFVKQVQTVDADATGKPFSTYEGLKAMKEGFTWAGIYAFIAMVVVLLLDFGNGKQTLIALAPLVMGLIATLGIMVIFGLSLNPANMIGFALVLGVGADNGVHVLHDYRRSRRAGRPQYSLNFATGWGIMVKALTTVIGFGTLMISRHEGMFSLGLVLTLGVTCCMLTALIFLPAILRLTSRREQEPEILPMPTMPAEMRRSA